MFDRKQIFRTGVLCSSDGLIRFFNNDDHSGARKDGNNKRNFYESKFYLNKRIFKEGKFRVRSDLFVGAVCYEREMDLSCKLLEIDIASGAVLVESILRNGVKNCLWISPDDLVGNCRETAKLKKGINDVQSHESICSIIPCSALSRIGKSRESFAEPQQQVIGNSQYTKKQYVFPQTADLEMPPSWYSSVSKLSPSLRASDNVRSEFQVGPREEYVRVQNITDLTLNGPSSEQRIKSDIGANSTFNNEILKYSSSINSLNSTSGGREIIDLTYEILEHADVSNTLLEEELPPPSSHSAFLPIPFELLDTNNRFDERIFTTSVGGPMLSSFAATAAAPAITSNGVFPSVCPSTTIPLELNLLKRHGVALEFLMSATDLPTMVASLHYVKSMQQSNVPLGPTALEVVTEAEMTSRALMEDALLKQMTLPIYSGGKGYNLRHAGMILCQMEPILGSKLGGLHTLSIDITKLHSLGLTSSEALDILPYIQKFEGDIIAKTLSLKRQLALICS